MNVFRERERENKKDREQREGGGMDGSTFSVFIHTIKPGTDEFIWHVAVMWITSRHKTRWKHDRKNWYCLENIQKNRMNKT